MPEITIKQNPSGDLKPGEDVTLTAKVDVNPDDYTLSWIGPDLSVIAGKQTPEGYAIEVKSPAAGKKDSYKASATPKGTAAQVPDKPCELESTGQSSAANETPLVFDKAFAWLTAIPIAILIAVLLAPLWWYEITRSYDEDAMDEIAILISLALLSIGAVALLLGVYAGLLEVRGRMRTTKEIQEEKVQARGLTEAAISAAAALVDSIGKLRGAALILVVACVPLLAAAWIAQTAVDNQTAPAPTATSVAGTPAPTDGSPEQETAQPEETPTPKGN